MNIKTYIFMRKAFEIVRDGVICGVIGGVVGSLITIPIKLGIKHWNDEDGTILYKENYEIHVDINGDKKTDRVLRPRFGHSDNLSCYEYAQPGDKITYNNKWKADTLTIDNSSRINEIRQINGKSLKDIKKWHGMNRHAKLR